MIPPYSKCIRYTEDPTNPGSGAGDCYDTHAGFDKPVLKCEDVIRSGRCRYGFSTPYGRKS